MVPYSYHPFQPTGRFHFRDFSLQQRLTLKSYEWILVRHRRLKNQKKILIESKKDKVSPYLLNVPLKFVESHFPSAHKEILSDRILYSKRKFEYA